MSAFFTDKSKFKLGSKQKQGNSEDIQLQPNSLTGNNNFDTESPKETVTSYLFNYPLKLLTEIEYDCQILSNDSDNDFSNHTASTKLDFPPIQDNENNHSMSKPLSNRQLNEKIHNEIADQNDYTKIQERTKKIIPGNGSKQQSELTLRMNNSLDKEPTSTAIMTLQNNRDMAP